MPRDVSTLLVLGDRRAIRTSQYAYTSAWLRERRIRYRAVRIDASTILALDEGEMYDGVIPSKLRAQLPSDIVGVVMPVALWDHPLYREYRAHFWPQARILGIIHEDGHEELA